MHEADRREPKPLALQPDHRPGIERRVYPRTETEIACKVRRDARTVFSTGRTFNLSPGGAALTLHGPRPAHVGERIAIAFEHTSCAITRAAHMITATIVRAEPNGDDTQHIGLAFDTPQFGLEALDRPAAA
ncbi:MAG: PilZ domain-containing protein [Planctomycetota bacterium]